MNTNKKPIDPIANIRNSNKQLPKATKDHYNLVALKGTRMVNKTSNKFLFAHGKMVVGTEKIVRLTKEIKVKKAKSRRRSK